jgi:phage terminase large subunit-like protein
MGYVWKRPKPDYTFTDGDGTVVFVYDTKLGWGRVMRSVPEWNLPGIGIMGTAGFAYVMIGWEHARKLANQADRSRCAIWAYPDMRLFIPGQAHDMRDFKP